jgi:hypothetical protein
MGEGVFCVIKCHPTAGFLKVCPSGRSGGRGCRFFPASAVQKSSGCGKRTEKDVPFEVRNNLRLVSADG